MPHVEDDLNRIIEAVRFIEPDALAPIQPGTDVDRVVQWVRDQREEILSLSRQASNFEQQLLASRRANDGMTQTLNERVAKLKAKDEEIKQLRTTLLRDVDGLQQKVKEKDDEITQLIKETVELEHRQDSLVTQRNTMELQRNEARQKLQVLEIEREGVIAGCKELREQRDELQRVFDLQWKADQRAIKRWQEANPDSLTNPEIVWPDRKELTLWLLNQVASPALIRERDSAIYVRDEALKQRDQLRAERDNLKQDTIDRQPDAMTIANLRSELDYVKKQLAEKQSKDHDEAFRRERVITTARMLMVAGVQSGKPVEDFLNSAAGFWSEVDRRFPPKS